MSKFVWIPFKTANHIVATRETFLRQRAPAAIERAPERHSVNIAGVVSAISCAIFFTKSGFTAMSGKRCHSIQTSRAAAFVKSGRPTKPIRLVCVHPPEQHRHFRPNSPTPLPATHAQRTHRALRPEDLARPRVPSKIELPPPDCSALCFKQSRGENLV